MFQTNAYNFKIICNFVGMEKPQYQHWWTKLRLGENQCMKNEQIMSLLLKLIGVEKTQIKFKKVNKSKQQV